MTLTTQILGEGWSMGPVLVELCRVAARYRGTYISHIRNETPASSRCRRGRARAAPRRVALSRHPCVRARS